MRKGLFVAVAAVFLITAGGSSALAKIGYGPVVVEDATVVEIGTFELKGDVILSTGQDVELYNSELKAAVLHSGVDRTTIQGEIVYGSTEKLQLGMYLPHISCKNDIDGGGMGDLVLGGKYCFVREGEALDPYMPGFSAGFYLAFPTGDEEVIGEDNKTDYIFKGMFSKALGTVNGHLNLSYTLHKEKKTDSVVEYGLAVEHPLETSEQLSLTCELVGSNEDIDGNRPMTLYGGLKYTLRPVWDVKAAWDVRMRAGVGMNDASPDFIVGIGVVFAGPSQL